MKQNHPKRLLAGIMAFVLISLVFVGSGIVRPVKAVAAEGTPIHWDFEDGNLAPFTLVSGSYGTIISNIPQAHNYPYDPYPRQGDYHLSTLESTTYYGDEESRYDDPATMTVPNESYQCVLHSPLFRLDSPEINFLVGGGSEGVYVALCDIYGRELVWASGNNSEVMTRVEWDLKYEDLVGEYVFIKIVDETSGGWGHITFDDFHAFGYVDETKEILPEPPNEIHWSFESGALAPFKVLEGEFGTGLIASFTTERNNQAYGKINKDGNYYLCSVEKDGTYTSYSEAYTGVIASPTFAIKDPTVTLKLGGGSLEYHDANTLYVAIVRQSDGTELVKGTLDKVTTYECDTNGDGVNDTTRTSGYMFQDISMTIPESLYVDGERVYLKIVDKATKSWGFICVDDIRAKGDIIKTPDLQVSTDYHEVAWDFEDGTIAPFKVNEGDTLNSVMITDIVCNINLGVNSTIFGQEIGKNGKYWLNTHINSYTHTVDSTGKVTAKSVKGAEGYVGELRSPVFVLDPQNTDITMQLGGNPNNVVAVYDSATGTKVGEAHAVNKVINGGNQNWIMQTRSVVWNDGFTYTEGQELYLQIEDTTTSNYGFVCVDYIHFRGRTVSEYQDISWNFEDGTADPFTVSESLKGLTAMVTDFAYDINLNTGNFKDAYNRAIGKNGNFWLNTALNKAPVVTVTNGVCTARPSGPSYNVNLTGTLRSPAFVLNPEDTEITMQLGGNPLDGVYVYDHATGEVVGEAHPTTHPNNGNAVSWMMQTRSVVWVEGFTYQKGQILYMEIVDNTSNSSNGGYGYPCVCVDNIRFSGNLTAQNYQKISWGFEDGTAAPFEVTGDSNLNPVMITDLSWDWNYRGVGKTLTGNEIGKKGSYWLNTYFNAAPVITEADGKSTGTNNAGGSEGYTGKLRSPAFILDPNNTDITMQLGGNVGNCVAVYDLASGEKVGEAVSVKNDWKMTTRTVVWNADFEYEEGQALYLQIEDKTTSGWAFVCVDDISFSGRLAEIDYAETIWSFESGTSLPFITSHSFGAGLINTYVQNQSVPHGKYYLNTVLLAVGSGSFDNNMTGELVSPEFFLNPDDPIITLSVMGGGDNSSSYVGVFSLETGELLARANGSDSWTVCNRTLDLTGKFIEGERLIMKIIDGTGGSGWVWVGVDNIRGSFAFPEASMLTTVSQVMKATGWTEEAYEGLTEIIESNTKRYGAEYTAGAGLLDELTTMKAKQARLASNGVKEGSSELKEWMEEMEALAYKIRTSTPALGSGLIAFTVHHQYAVDHQNTHNMFPSYNGEISDKAKYTPGGAVKVFDVKTGNVFTLLTDTDGLYRDLDVSYNSDKILLSYRNDRNDTYNIYEYTLNDDRTAVVETKQLTSLSTADDMDPMYLPSGDIVFSSTRDPKYVMCNRQISANIYRMESDGANIVKITSSTLYERPTDVLPDGRILYDRWEYNDRDFASAQGLWTVYEDGTKQDTYYGNNSPTGATIEGKVIPGTNKIMATLSSCHDVSWGAVAIIDRSKGVDGRDPVEKTWPASVQANIGNPNENKNNIDAYKSLTVKYEDPQPLSEEYFLVSRTLPGSSKMGIYLLDIYGNETLLYEDSSAMSCFDATVLQVREKEIDTSDRRNYNDAAGSFFIQDVYEGTHMDGVERGTVKTLRIVESVDKKYISQSQSTSWSGEGAQAPGMNWHSFEAKRVIGEVPVYEDGSAYFEVPQDVFVYFQLLDEDGKMIQSMRSGTLVQSGEKTGCIGCHEDRRTAPSTTSGRNTPMALEANVKVIDNPDYVAGSNLPMTIAVNTPDVPQKRIFDAETGTDLLVDYNDPRYFPEYTDLPTMNFLTEVQPIFTKNCLTCHGYENPEANLTLVPDKDIVFNAAYINLWVDRNKTGVPFENLVGAVGGGDSRFYTAKTWGSYVSPLVQKIYTDETHKNLLTDAEKRRIAEWVDLNGTYYGDYSTNYGYNQAGRSPLTAAERTSLGDTRSHGWTGFQLNTFSMAIYFDNPEKSPILQGKTGAEYDAALAIIQTGLQRLRTNPDVDWRGLTAVPGNPNLTVNPYRLNKIDQWRCDKVGLYDAMEAANRAAIVAGIKKYDSDYEAVMAAKNAEWPGWPTANNPGTYYTQLPG